jgi:hypothetical protein
MSIGVQRDLVSFGRHATDKIRVEDRSIGKEEECRVHTPIPQEIEERAGDDWLRTVIEGQRYNVRRPAGPVDGSDRCQHPIGNPSCAFATGAGQNRTGVPHQRCRIR